MAPRFAASDLIAFARALLNRTGLGPEKSDAVAETLVEGDLLGYTTHGLALLAPYLGELEKGSMEKSGGPWVVADFPAAVTWDGRRLPGPWLVRRALDLACRRARTTGAATVVIRRSHHIACLAAYLGPVTAEGLVVVLTCSDPTVATVAPHGGRRGVYTPNPIAAAWPTADGPVIFDLSTSITTNGLVKRLRAEQRTLPGDWLVDADGRATRDPSTQYTTPPGALLPVGGLDHGHKGYALGLLVEMLTSALGGHGRSAPREGWTASVFIQVFDPALFGGADGFVRETTHLADACRATPTQPGVDRVRLPGEGALRRRTDQLERGVDLHAGIMPTLAPWAERLGVSAPTAAG